MKKDNNRLSRECKVTGKIVYKTISAVGKQYPGLCV